MSGCSDLCTAAKCKELEQRISALEQALELLEASFEAHTNQDIPEAHNYEPKVNVSLAVNDNDNSLKVFVKVDDQSDDETVTLPEQNSEVEVSLATNSTNNSLKVFVKVGDQSDDETITLPTPLVQVDAAIDQGDLAINVQVGENHDIAIVKLPTPLVQVDAAIDQGDLAVNVQVGENHDIAIVKLPIFEPASKSNLRLNGSFNNGELTLSVADGESQDSINISIPRRGGGGGSTEDEPINLNIDGIFQDEKLYLTIAGGGSFDTAVIDIPIEVETLELSTINVEQVECVDGVPEINIVSVAVLKGTEAAEREKYAANAKMLKAQCELVPVAAAPDWWQVRIGANRPQIVCVFRKVGSRTYHSLTIPHPAEVEISTEPILPSYQKGNVQGMIVLTDNSKFIINCVSVAEAERMCAIAASKIIGSYLPNPYKVWITERKGEPVGESQMQPTSIYYYSQGQENLKPDWRFAIPPDLEPI